MSKSETHFIDCMEFMKSKPNKYYSWGICDPPYGIDIKGGNQASDSGIPAMAINGNGMANKRSVWTVNTKPNSEAHFAIFPQELIVPCIKAGCPEGGIVLDPFMGSGTTGIVARKLNRNFVGIELNPEYIKICDRRLSKELGMFI